MPGRILIVDDSVELRVLIGRILRRSGYDVVEVGDGVSAIACAQKESFDAVVSDVNLPGMGGLELLRTLRDRDASLPVLLISGAPDLETALGAVELGAFVFLTKPFDAAKLLESVARAVDKRQSSLSASVALRAQEKGEGAPEPAERRIGSLVAERYRLRSLLGQGGMGAVYEALDEHTQQIVALKILHATLSSERALTRFRREAEVIASLDHPNIIHLFEAPTKSGELAYLVMERLRGISLGHLIALEGALPVERVVGIVTQVLSALAQAHAHHVVHRDLKPDNVFLSSGPEGDIVHVLDFGIAKILGGPEDQKLTRTGAVLGTPAYMAPEQARGQRVDARIDLYAVGCVLYEALTGTPPFVADNYNAMLVAILESRPKPIRRFRDDVPDGLIDVVERAMARNQADRFLSADEMSRALEPWRAAAPISTPLPARPSEEVEAGRVAESAVFKAAAVAKPISEEVSVQTLELRNTEIAATSEMPASVDPASEEIQSGERLKVPPGLRVTLPEKKKLKKS